MAWYGTHDLIGPWSQVSEIDCHGLADFGAGFDEYLSVRQFGFKGNGDGQYRPRVRQAAGVPELYLSRPVEGQGRR